jgi:hypothetical protein
MRSTTNMPATAGTIDYSTGLLQVLKNLYNAKPPEMSLLESTQSYVLSLIGPPPEAATLTPAQIAAKKEAIDQLYKMGLASQFNEEDLCEKLITAYDLLVKGCLATNVAIVKQGIAAIDEFTDYIYDTDKSAHIKKALLNIQYAGHIRNYKLDALGFLGYAATQHCVEITKVLIEAGANTNTTKGPLKFPILFHVVEEPVRSQHFFVLWQAVQQSIRIPYLGMRKQIEIFLTNKFDLTLLYNGRNILEHIIPTKMSDIQYPAFILSQTIARLYDETTLDRLKCKEFFKKLSDSNTLKFFPALALRYNENYYPTKAEKDFYSLKYIISSLITFCDYQKWRMEKGLISFIKTEKNTDLNEIYAALINLESNRFMLDPADFFGTIPDVANTVNVSIKKLNAIFNMHRITNITPPESAQDWNQFYADNITEIKAIKLMANNIQSNHVNKLSR